LLFSNGGEACVVAGLDRGPYELVVVVNTHDTHNVIVCTLCSSYPRWLLGLPPDRDKSRAYRSRMVRAPRAVLREFGTEIPDDVTVHGQIPKAPHDGRYSVDQLCLVHNMLI
jgi:nitrile hydratase